MKEISKISLFISLFLLIGFPIIFFVIFLFTGQWFYLFSGSVPSALVGTFCIFILLQPAIKKEDEKV